MHLGHEPVPDPLLQPPAHGGHEEPACRDGVEPPDPQRRKTVERGPSFGVTYGERHRDRLGEQPPGHELQGLQGHLVQPLSVVDENEHGSGLGGPGEQGEHGEADQEAVGRVSGRHRERHTQDIALRCRQLFELTQERRAQLVQARVGQLHIGFDAVRPGHSHP